VLVSVGSTIISIVISTLAAYSVTRFRYRYRMAVPYFSLLGYMVPSIILVFPLFIVMTNLGLTDSLWSLILGYVSTTPPSACGCCGVLPRIPVELRGGLIDGRAGYASSGRSSCHDPAGHRGGHLLDDRVERLPPARVFMNTVEHYPHRRSDALLRGRSCRLGLMMASAADDCADIVLFMLLQRYRGRFRAAP
jgi:hypothetical protein